jgi:hypothetical protein
MDPLESIQQRESEYIVCMDKVKENFKKKLAEDNKLKAIKTQ